MRIELDAVGGNSSNPLSSVATLMVLNPEVGQIFTDISRQIPPDQLGNAANSLDGFELIRWVMGITITVH